MWPSGRLVQCHEYVLQGCQHAARRLHAALEKSIGSPRSPEQFQLTAFLAYYVFRHSK